MKFFTYLRYFFYLAYNWNFTIALHLIRNEIRGEKKYGIHTTGEDELDHLKERGVDITHSTIYMPAAYDMLEELFSQQNIHHCKYLLDLGCGKGRVLCVAAHKGFTNLTGLEISKDFCLEAEKNLEAIKQKFPSIKYKIINNDAFYFNIPASVDCIFMFNPFDKIIMSGVINNIEMSLQKNPRKLFIVYINPLHKNLFMDAGYKEVYHRRKLKYLEASILQKTLVSRDENSKN